MIEAEPSLEKKLLEESDSLMHAETARVQKDIVRMRQTVQREIVGWARKKLADDPGSQYAVRGYVVQCLRNMEGNLQRLFAMARADINMERAERDRNIKTFCDEKRPSP